MPTESQPLTCPCPHCGGLIEFPPEMAGAGTDCPHCGTPVNLIEPSSDPTSSTPPDDGGEAGPGTGNSAEHSGEHSPSRPPRPNASDVAAAFRGRMPAAHATLGYRVALLLVSTVMLILPSIYLALVAGVAALLWRFATRGIDWVQSIAGGDAKSDVLIGCYLLGLFVVGFVLLFLVKPLFSRPGRRTQRLALNPAAEPLLFAMVHMVADVVGAPRPARIEVDCKLNASAGFRGDRLGLGGRDFVLTLGLPLVAAFDARTLAGVVAHELGHFKQGWGLRASLVVRRVNSWLWRVAFERDVLDEMVAEYAQTETWGVGQILLAFARTGVWLSRAVLRVLVHAGHAVSCLLLRQLERDADRCQIAVAGSDHFEHAIRRIDVLNEAGQDFYRQLRVRWETDRRLPDDAPSCIAMAESAVTEDRRDRIIEAALARTPAMFDSHPTRRERLEQARQAAAPGLFHLDLPASALFANFDTLARQATVLHYEEDLGLPRQQIEFIPAHCFAPADGANDQAAARQRSAAGSNRAGDLHR